MPQNLLLHDSGKQFAMLLQEMPALRAMVYSGWTGIVDLLQLAGLGDLVDCPPEMPRIVLYAAPCHPAVFHSSIGRYFGLLAAFDRSATPTIEKTDSK